MGESERDKAYMALVDFITDLCPGGMGRNEKRMYELLEAFEDAVRDEGMAAGMSAMNTEC